MLNSRYRALNSKAPQEGPVLYWMDRELRMDKNWAFVRAAALAAQTQKPLLVVYNLVANFLSGGARQWQFKIETLRELQQEFAEKKIPFAVLLDETGAQSPTQILAFCKTHGIGQIVTDFSPLRIQQKWKKDLAEQLDFYMEEVDAHNVVPVWIASQKQEYGAYTLRPKLHRLLPRYLDEFPSHPSELETQIQAHFFKRWVESSEFAKINWAHLAEHPAVPAEHSLYRKKYEGGKAAGAAALAHFLEATLPRYADARNDPNADGQSDLSPYLHYGILSPQAVALAVLKKLQQPISALLDASKNKAKVDETKPVALADQAAAFLEELLVRRELADNFCFYNPHYDSVKAFPAWAQKTLAAHALDPREFLYTQKQFEEAKTHDELWNAAQNELLKTGKMHGYLRMFWAKKILEWTPSVEEAFKIAIHLNDRYELDGRDPNGYAGIAWSLGGVHDRAWFERPIFGQIRFMARSGCEKKFKVKAYVQKWNNPDPNNSTLF